MMKKRSDQFKSNSREHDFEGPSERDLAFEEKMVLAELLYERIQTYRALLNVQTQLMDRIDAKLFEKELERLRKELEDWL